MNRELNHYPKCIYMNNIQYIMYFAHTHTIHKKQMINASLVIEIKYTIIYFKHRYISVSGIKYDQTHTIHKKQVINTSLAIETIIYFKHRYISVSGIK